MSSSCCILPRLVLQRPEVHELAILLPQEEYLLHFHAFARGGLTQELTPVGARALESPRHRITLRDQRHGLLLPVGEGRAELGEQSLHPASRPWCEELLHNRGLLTRVDGINHAPYHGLVLLRHPTTSSFQRGGYTLPRWYEV